MDDTLTDALAGRLLDGRYAVTARIAHGGMATVYLATDTRLDRQVALKVMHAELARDTDFVRRFIDEAKSVARLSHQNVVAVYDQGADGAFLYLAMEYVPGRTLKDLLRERGRFTPAAALDVISGVLAGLAAAHTAGIVHRDVKPENVLLTEDGRVKVADFGLARAQAAAGHTRSGIIIGTVAYLPPEQVTGEAPSGSRGDVYSAGVLLFEMLTGRQPHTGETPIAVAYQHVNQDVPLPSAIQAGIPAAVDELVLVATRRDPAQRPGDAGQFLRSVRNVREGLAPGSRNGLASLAGAGAQGTSEAPWLGSGPASGGWSAGTWNTGGWNTDPGGGWQSAAATLPPAIEAGAGPGGHSTGPNSTGSYSTNSYSTGSYNAGSYSTGSYSTGSYNAGSYNAGSPGHAGDSGFGLGPDRYGADGYEPDGAGTNGAFGQNHTLVVHRDQGGGGGGGSFLGRWLFGPRLALVALLAVLAVLAGYGAWYVTGGRDASIPVVAGDTPQTATSILEAAGFQVLTGSEPSNSFQQGQVAGTSPTGQAPKGSKVVLLVSTGPFKSTIPDVKGDTKNAALAALSAVHLTATTQLVGSSLPIGTVVGTTPKAGTSWPQTQPVTLLIAGGKALPNFKGMTQDQARAIAQQEGLQLQFNQDQNGTAAQGTIESQSPAAGSVMTPNENVTLTVSAGGQMVPLPDVITDNVQSARAILESAGFHVVVNGPDFLATVWNEDPSSGQAPFGSTVTIYTQGSFGNGNGNDGNGNGH
jgi:eukaryotic-like serine/threonine-protein kinase